MGGKVLKLRSEELIEQGLEQGLEQGIKGVILSEIQKNNSDVEIIAKLKDYFSLTEEKAKEYYDKYSGAVLV